jgi:hypothetical protein
MVGNRTAATPFVSEGGAFAGGGTHGAALKRPRSDKCGECRACLNPRLKRGCEKWRYRG